MVNEAMRTTLKMEAYLLSNTACVAHVDYTQDATGVDAFYQQFVSFLKSILCTFAYPPTVIIQPILYIDNTEQYCSEPSIFYTVDLHVLTVDLHVLTVDLHVLTVDLHVLTVDLHVLTLDSYFS